jgi:hypothetical protein
MASVRVERTLEPGGHTNEGSITPVLQIPIGWARTEFALLGLDTGVDEGDFIG